MFLSTLYDQESSQMVDSVFSLCGFALVQTLLELCRPGWAYSPKQSNLPNSWIMNVNHYAQFTKIILKGEYELITSKLAILSALETGPRNGLY